jgi:hypothetical protein
MAEVTAFRLRTRRRAAPRVSAAKKVNRPSGMGGKVGRGESLERTKGIKTPLFAASLGSIRENAGFA